MAIVDEIRAELGSDPRISLHQRRTAAEIAKSVSGVTHQRRHRRPRRVSA
jgi:hypothetical protein